MIVVFISTALVQSILDEIFRRIELARDPGVRAQEMQFAWFEIIGMRKIVIGQCCINAVHCNGYKSGNPEYQQIRNMLGVALEKVTTLAK